jgi:HAD superfamily hydrolase (TIGR01490 family)
LISGSVEPIVRPLARHLGVGEVLAARLETREGTTTGQLENGALAGEHKAQAIVRFAADRGIDLSEAYAYGDSLDDVPMLERVAKPAVVNPGRRLARLARARGWDVYRWPAPADFGLDPV